MTLLGAMNCGDYLLFGADSAVTAGAYQSANETKIHRRAAPALAWSFTGDEGLGFAFREWFEMQAGGWTDWEHFRQAVVSEVSRRNGQRRRELGYAMNPGQGDALLLAVLIAGSMTERLRILVIDTDGTSGFQENRKWVFAGAGASAARYVMEGVMLERNSANLEPDVALARRVMETTADHVPGCARPIQMVRVSPTGVTDL